MTETWVANASPVIVLAKVGQLALLEAPNHRLVVPEAVAAEVMQGPRDDPARRAIESGWPGERTAVEPHPLVLEWGLGGGETAVLSLALRAGAVAVLDDGAARTAARALGVETIGTLGVVLRARRARRIESAAAVLTALREAGLHLSDTVIREAMARATGETWPTDPTAERTP